MEAEVTGKNERLMEEGSFWQLLVKLSLPAVVVILIMIIYNMADTFFIGQTGNPDKITAISLCMPVFTVLSGLGTLFGIGGGTSISIALGKKDEACIKNVIAFCCAGILVVGIVFAIILFLFTEPICDFLGADVNTIGDAITYLKVFAFACPFVIFSNAFGNILRSDGEATTAMIANMCGTIFNIVGDAIFILVFHWDVLGAALATVLGNMLAVALIIYIMKKKKPMFFPQMKYLCWKAKIIVPVLTLGLPMTFSTILNSISGTLQNRLMMEHGSVYLAAQSVAGKFGMLIVMLVMGFCMGMQPAISYNYGRKDEKRMNQIVTQIGLFTVGLGILLALLIYELKDVAIAVFIQDEQVIAYGQIFVLASVIVAPICAIYQVCQTFLQATGKASYAIFVSLLDKGIMFIPILFVMNHFYGAYGIAFAHMFTMLGSVVVALILAFRWRRLIAKTNKEDESYESI